jgi:hypothetical protein
MCLCSGQVFAPRGPVLGGRRCHHAHVDQFEAEAGDPLHEAVEGALIRELGTKCCCGGAHADFAVVEFGPQYAACLADESDLVGS